MANDPRRSERIAAVGYDLSGRTARPVGACNLCGERRRRVVAQRDRYELAVCAVRCAGCGLVFLDPMLSPEEYADFYTRWYRPLVSAYHGRRIDATTLPADQRRYAESLVGWLGPQLAARAPRTLLDAGGSTGVVALALQSHFDLAATVLDPSPDELEVAAAAGLATAAGFIEDFTPPGDQRYDLVTLCQTADHLLDLRGALTRVRQWLAPGGALFVDIVDYLAVARRSGHLQAALKLDHPYSLSDETLRCYLARSGFAVTAQREAADDHLAYLCHPCPPDPGARPAAAAMAAEWRGVREGPGAVP